ncbi:hypothetical protein FA95DRAFT_405517 [Auriscalpium vulgare]|uniref:Uncharacterized protein n=1 Tax=Auriscalpium vulgare TaxID=40419 RepID=A0ACB8RHI8_9AGAM|nr:hypothetical protein FA95DRAFT_405517 [Auriscalpium vulgare]
MAIDVPLDVHNLIIEWVFRSSQGTAVDWVNRSPERRAVDLATLCACALVCRAWTPTAQRLIFRRVICFSLDDHQCNIQLLVRTLCTRPHLAAHVRYIHITWPSRPDYGSVCLDLLEICRHVEGISFQGGVDDNQVMSAELEARMRAIQLKPVVLDMFGLSPTHCRTIVNMWPGARMLKFNAYYNHPLPPTVEALEIYGEGALNCLSHSHPLPALRYLCLITPWWQGTLAKHLISTGILPQLQSLRIKDDFPPPEVLKQLTQLRTLIVSPPTKPITLPPSLRHVGYHLWVALMPRVRAKLVVDPLRMLPELKLVTVEGLPRQHVRALEGMCREKCVDFVTYAEPVCFEQPRHTDWI